LPALAEFLQDFSICWNQHRRLKVVALVEVAIGHFLRTLKLQIHLDVGILLLKLTLESLEWF